MPIYTNLGDAVEGSRIACQFRKIGKTREISGRTSRHGGMTTVLYDAYCVIERPIRLK